MDSQSSQIFISYAHADQPRVMPQIAWLKSQGHSVWYDEAIRPGEAWRDELANAISDSALCLYFVSPRSVQSANCRKEVNFALESEIPIVVVYIEETDLPPGLRLALSDIQAILAYGLGEDQYHKTLSSSIERLLKNPRASEVMLSDRRPLGHGVPVDYSAAPVIAVLPFENVGDDEAQQYFSDGISEDILNGLTKQSGLSVIARTSSFRFKSNDFDVQAVGSQLGASHILSGSIRAHNTRIRVNVELVSTGSGELLWSERYVRDLDDVFAMQDEIANEILDALHIQLRQYENKQNIPVEAYDHFLEARHHYSRLDFNTASECAEKAIEADPTYAAAYMLLAGMHAMKVWFWFSSMHRELPRIKYYSNIARSLQPDLTNVDSQDLVLLFFVEHKFEEALTELHSLILENPNHHDLCSMYSCFLMSLRDFDGSVAVLDRLITLDPLAATYHRLRAERLTLGGRYEEAKETLNHTSRIGMPDPMQYGYLAFMQGDSDGLGEQLEALRGQMGDDHMYYRVAEARWYFLQEDYKKAGEALESVKALAEKWEFHYMLAHISQLTNQGEQFLLHMEQALEIGEFPAYQNYTLGGIWGERYPDLANGERYQEMLARFGLDGSSIEKMDITSLRL